MLTTNTTASRAKEDDGKRRVVTTTTMKPGRVRFMQSEFPGVQKRETRKIDSSVKFNTTELDHLVNKFRSVLAKPAREAAPAPAIKTPQPKPAKKAVAKKAAPKKRKVK
jgi:hypothetical protein